MSSNGRSEEPVIQYKKIKMEAGRILPDAPQGEWSATVLRSKTKVSPTKNGDPMVTFQLRLDRAEESENESCQGTQLPLRVIFVDDMDGGTPAFAKRRTKMVLRELASQCSFDLEIIPSTFGEDQESVTAALTPFINAVEGRELQVWTTHRKDKQDPNVIQVDVNLSRPGASYGGQTTRQSDDD